MSLLQIVVYCIGGLGVLGLVVFAISIYVSKEEGESEI